MRKALYLLLFVSVITIAKAQVANGSFENWYSDTSSFSFGSYVPNDTFYYTSPVNWTCINAITMDPGLGDLQLVDSSSYAYAGSKSLYMYTDTLFVPGVGLNLVLPGFVVNGNFHLNLNSLLGGSATLSPLAFQGAGVPFTQRVQGFGLYMKYLPITNDSCLLWAVLKKGNVVIADAKYNTTQTFNTFTYIEKDFTYYSCEMPDTLIFLLASSTPDLATIASGNTGLTGGSQIWIDSVELVTGPGNFTVLPAPANISSFTLENTPKTINVLPIDTDCSGTILTAGIAVNALHGNAVISGPNVIYTPTTGYSGTDTMVYSITNGSLTRDAYIFMNIFHVSGINEISEYINICPNPASEQFRIENQSGIDFEAKVFNSNGEVAKQLTVQNNDNVINISDLSSGIYLIRGVSINGQNEFVKKVIVVR